MNKRTTRFKNSMLAAVMALAMSATPMLANAAPNNEAHRTELFGERAASVSQMNNQCIIDLMGNADPEQFRTWDTSLAPLSQKQADEIRIYIKENIIKGETDPYKNARSIYNWIGKNIQYARRDQFPYINPYDIFVHKVAVCGGFSNLYKAMLNLAGIPSTVVFGDSTWGAHEWNLVYANGKWFHSDSTWATTGDYFEKSVVDFSKDHKANNVYGLSLEGANNCQIGFQNGYVSALGTTFSSTSLITPETYKQFPVEAISIDAFTPELRSIHLSKSIKEIDVKGATSSPKLEKITVDAANATYAAKDNVLYKKDLSKIFLYPSGKLDASFTIPKETTNFDNKETFATSALKDLHVEAGNSVYSSYEGVVLNKEQTEIVCVPNGKEVVKVPGTVRLDSIALNSKEHLKEVVLEDGIKSIPEFTFSNCRNLEKITIPESVTEIKNYAFGQAPGSANEWIPEKFTIRGKKGSYAETYAKKKGITFEEIKDVIPQPELKPAEWKKNSTGWWYLRSDGTYPVNQWEYIGGCWYYFDGRGYMYEQGWHWIGGKCYYMYANGSMASNTWIGSDYVDASGAWIEGKKPMGTWQKDHVGWWYLYENGIYPVNQWDIIGGSWYYFDGRGYMYEQGWHWIGGKCYYMYANGSMASNTWIEGYYVDASGAWVQ